MKLNQLLPREHVNIARAESKKHVLDLLVKLLASGLLADQRDEIFNALIARERLGSTAIGEGIALPHARMPSLHRTQLALLRLEQGIDFQAPDQQPVLLFFALLVPGQQTDQHLELLAQLTQVFSDQTCKNNLLNATTADALYEYALQCLEKAELADEVAIIELTSSHLNNKDQH